MAKQAQRGRPQAVGYTDDETRRRGNDHVQQQHRIIDNLSNQLDLGRPPTLQPRGQSELRDGSTPAIDRLET